MKRKLIFGIVSILIVTLTSCGTKRHFVKIQNGKLIDKRLVGVWTGNESGNIVEGMSSEWKMTRNINGIFSLEVKAKLNGEIIEAIENGNWWIENGLFHEFHDVSGGTDIYQYEIMGRKQIKFRAKKMSIEVVNKNYEFIDTKKSE
ncbi:MAG: hypothetical protein NWQ17_07095 [Polaribacter sp.]|nr:hypothetical protein [Polaribacter sp.]